MFAAIRSFFQPRVAPASRIGSESAVAPWRRPTFGKNMRPRAGIGNFEGTFCRDCGDWIIDSAYYSEHSGKHRPLRGSWNYENPMQRRSHPDDIKPTHDQWLDEMRAWAKSTWESKTIAMSTTSGGIQPMEDRGFHSEAEAQGVLEPYGMKLEYFPNSGWSRDGRSWSGGWQISSTAKFSERPGAPKPRAAPRGIDSGGEE